jgi:hypothetical protein
MPWLRSTNSGAVSWSMSIIRVSKDYGGQPEDIMVALQLGSEVGLRPMEALQNIAVINGRPAGPLVAGPARARSRRAISPPKLC